MPEKITQIKVFISCPSDVNREKDIVVNVCKRLSSILRKRNISVRSIHWDDIPPVITGEGPQNIIDKHLDDSNYDIYLGILWKKFGEPLENGLTPTESEFENAFNKYKVDRKRPLIVVFRKEKEFYPNSAYEIEQFSSVQIFFERIKPLGLYKPFKEDLEFQGLTFETIQEFIDELTIVEDSKVSFTRKKFEGPVNYLKRKVCPKNEYKPEWGYLNKDNVDVVDLLNQGNRIVIIGDAGVGKTTELKRITSYYSEDNSKYFPFFISLNKYVDQKIEDFLPERWESIPENQLLLILDGLDEIESKNKRDAIRKIELFAEQHSSATMIVSCRSNLYQSSAVNTSGTLKDFKEFVLLPIDRYQIDSYLNMNLARQVDDFNDNIKKNQLNDLLYIPFYLSELVNLYRAKMKLPNSRATLFENFVLLRLAGDAEHYRTTIELEDKRELIIVTLEKIALYSETLGRNSITDDEMRGLLPDVNIRNLMKYCSLINKSDGKVATWQFEHNNIQEYLAAKVLAHQQLEIVKAFISFEPDYRKIIPAWVNTISFLLTISPDQKLVEWILEIEPEVTIKVEPDRIETPVRIAIFKNIFNNYKDKKIWIDRDKFNYDELARFGQDNKIIDFLISEAQNATHYTILSNAFEILARMKIPTHYRETITDLLTNIALDNFSIKVPEHVRQDALMAISDLRYDSKEVVDKLVAELKNNENDWIRYGLYYFLHNSEYLDEHIDIFLEGIKYVLFDLHNIEDGRSRLGNERTELIEGLKKTASKSSVSKILNYFIANTNDIHDLFIGNHEIAFLAVNAVKIYEEDHEILDLVLTFALHLLESHHEEAKQFEVFFDKTDSRFVSFKIVMGKDSHAKEQLLADLADHQCLQYYIEQYEKELVSEKDVWHLLNTLRWRNKDIFDWFYKNLNEKYADKFKIVPQPDWEKIRNERSQKDFDLLFNKDSFMKEVEMIFEQEHKKSFTQDELLKLRSDDWPQERYSILITEILRGLSGTNGITAKQAIEKLNQYDWDWFAISNIYEKVMGNKQLIISDKQKEYISEWCLSNLSKVDFKKSITKTDVASYSIKLNAIFLWYFYQRFELKFPKVILLDMLSFDYKRKGIGYLEKSLPFKDISERILKNLENGIEINDVLRNHIEYCTNHDIVEVLPFAYNEVKDAKADNEIRRISLEAIIKLDKEHTGLEKVLNDINDGFKWNVVEALINKSSNCVFDYLRALLTKGDAEDKIRATGYLIKLQDINALEYYVEYIKRENRFDRDMYDASSLSSLTTASATPYLIDLLKLTYQETFQQPNTFEKLDRLVLAALRSISLESEGNYQQVRQSIEHFITEYINVYENVNWLNSFFDQLEQQYFINKSQKLTMDDVIEKLEMITF